MLARHSWWISGCGVHGAVMTQEDLGVLHGWSLFFELMMIFGRSSSVLLGSSLIQVYIVGELSTVRDILDRRVLSIIVGNGLDDKIALEGLRLCIVIVCPSWVGPTGYIMGIYIFVRWIIG
ncbi:hypothetical protein OROMI_008126 [Orobanche minor]